MSRMGIAKSLTWMGGTSLLGQIITWAVTIWVARLLTPEDYGLVALSGLFTVFAQSVSEMGVGAAVIQSRSLSGYQIQALYGFSLVMGVAMTLVGTLAGPIMSWLFGDSRLTSLVAFQSLVFLLAAMKSMQRNILVRDTRFDVIAKVETLSRVLTSGATLSLAAAGFGYWALAAQWLFIEFFQFLMFCWVERVTPTLRIRYGEIREILHFGIQTVGRNIVSQLYALVDTAILGKLATKDFLGAYGFSKQLANMPFEKVIRIINQVLFPYLARKQDDLHILREWTLKIFEYQILIIAPFYYLLFFCAEETVHILLGPNWSDAVFPLKIFCIASLFKLAESYNMNCMTAMGMISGQIRYMIMLLFAISIGMFALAKTLGAVYSTLIWITIYPVLSILFSRILFNKLKLSFMDLIKYIHKTLIANTLAIVAIYFTSLFNYSDDIISLSVKVISGIFVYTVANIIFNKSFIRELYSKLTPIVKKSV